MNSAEPKVFTSDDRELLFENKGRKCFARKFDMDVDKEIIDRLPDRLTRQTDK